MTDSAKLRARFQAGCPGCGTIVWWVAVVVTARPQYTITCTKCTPRRV